MADLKKTLKKIAAIIALGITLAGSASVGGAYTYHKGKIAGQNESIEARKDYDISRDKTEIFRFNVEMKQAKTFLEEGKIKWALDCIINANGALSKVEILDKRELQAKLEEVRWELNKALKEKGVEDYY